jgi:ubiquinone/menaquinone biosynthesis C-methylase UbiE
VPDDFTAVTEVPGLGASREQRAMLFTRYAYAARLCDGKTDLLEVACGSGQGLGYLAGKARRVVGGDYTEALVQRARRHYGGRVAFVRLDAHALPFGGASFDVVLLYEAIYYLAEPDRFVAECRRVLRSNGVLVVCTVNKEWPDFNPSPYSVAYCSARDLTDLLRRHRFDVKLYGAFPVAASSLKDRVVSRLKRTAVALNLIPRTMKGKELLKRMFFGPLTPLPQEIDEGFAPYCEPLPITADGPNHDFKVLFAVAHMA